MLEFVEREGAWVEERGYWTAGNVVAEEGGYVDDEGETEGYACCSEAGESQQKSLGDCV